MNDSLNPVWNQTFDFVVEDGLHDMLILEVWDHDTFGKVETFYNLFFFVIFFFCQDVLVYFGFPALINAGY